MQTQLHGSGEQQGNKGTASPSAELVKDEVLPEGLLRAWQPTSEAGTKGIACSRQALSILLSGLTGQLAVQVPFPPTKLIFYLLIAAGVMLHFRTPHKPRQLPFW